MILISLVILCKSNCGYMCIHCSKIVSRKKSGVSYGVYKYGVLRVLVELCALEIPLNPTVRGGEWSFKDYESRKILVGFHTSRILVFLAAMCVSQSRFFHETASKSRFFARVRKFQSNSVKFTSFRHLILNL